MSKKIRVGIIFGGRSGEHEVSLVSAESVIKAMDKSKYEIIPIGITKEGIWITRNQPLKILKANKFKEFTSDQIITPDSTKKSLVTINKHFTTHNKINKNIDIIFPILHGTFGEDGTIQGLLELANIPYVGANVLASAIGMDKVIQKQVFQNIGLPIVSYISFTTNDYKNRQSAINKQ
ncbi:D-alanine--D-alanine ligase A, partial [Patescibacteria group bacterium]|nr:D-alanine--D-alanine ligase A [Patescibacteria group bacterium]